MLLKAVILDLGGIVFGISVDRIIESWAESAGCDPESITPKFRVDKYYRCFETGEISPEQYRKHACNLLGIKLSDEDFDRGWNSIYLDLLPDIEQLLRKIQHRLRLVALTNTNVIHAMDWRVRYSSILRYFEKIFASHEIGARKPDPESFNIVLDYLGISPEKAAFFDDSMENVNGAIALGINGFVANSPGEVMERLRGIW